MLPESVVNRTYITARDLSIPNPARHPIPIRKSRGINLCERGHLGNLLRSHDSVTIKDGEESTRGLPLYPRVTYTAVRRQAGQLHRTERPERPMVQPMRIRTDVVRMVHKPYVRPRQSFPNNVGPKLDERSVGHHGVSMCAIACLEISRMASTEIVCAPDPIMFVMM